MDKPRHGVRTVGAFINHVRGSRLAHYRNAWCAIRSDSRRTQAQLSVGHNGFVRYVDADPKTQANGQAMKPLDGAKVTVIPNEEEPGL